jgi:hypothetical protein
MAEFLESDQLPARATLAVKKGPIWPGGVVAASLRLDGDRLAITIEPQQLGGAERGTIKRLLGKEALAKLKAERPVTLEIAVAGARFSFSDAPGRRAAIMVELEDRPKLALNFLDWSAVEDVAHRANPAQILKRTGDVLGGRRSAREAREAWRQALERLGAGD